MNRSTHSSNGTNHNSNQQYRDAFQAKRNRSTERDYDDDFEVLDSDQYHSSGPEDSNWGESRNGEESRYANRGRNNIGGSYEFRGNSWRSEPARTSRRDNFGDKEFSGSSDIYGRPFDSDSSYYQDRLEDSYTGQSSMNTSGSGNSDFNRQIRRSSRHGNQANSSFDAQSNPLQRRSFSNASMKSQGGQEQSFAGVGPKGYSRSKDRIIEEVNDILTDSAELDASGIEVDCENGEVILRGNVPSRQCKRHAEELAEGVRGVKDVRNELRVASNSENDSEKNKNSGKSGPVAVSSGNNGTSEKNSSKK